MRIRIDLKILFFLVILYFTKQIKPYLIIMFFSVIHELGHMLIGILLKMKPEKLEIMPFGVSVSFYNNYDDKYLNLKEILVAIAGPITSLCLAIFLTNEEAIYSNILILFFNLIPIYPLDGGRIIKGILSSKMGIIRTEKIIEYISYMTMIILTLLSSIAVYYYKNIAIFLICVFLWSVVLKEKNNKTIDILPGK